MNLIFRRLESAANFDGYHRLFQDCFPETAGTSLQTRAHYDWKYGPGGKCAPSFEFLALEGPETLGYYAALPFPYRIGESQATAGLVCDVMTSSNARGKGVFTEIGRYATAAMGAGGIDFVTGYPIRSYVFPGHLKIGWRIAFPLPVYGKILNPQIALENRGMSLLGWLARPFAAGYRSACRATRRSIPQGTTCSRPLPAEYFSSTQHAAFMERWSNAIPFHLQRTPDFYRWRLGAPETSYQLSVAHTSQGDTCGLAIARSSAVQGIPVTSVLDFLVLAEHRGCAGVLHDDLERICRENRTAGLVFMTNPSSAARVDLFRNAFVKTGVEFKLILKWLSPNATPSHFWDEPGWHLTWADTDNL